MITIELFSGTKSFSAVALQFGHRTFTVDNDNNLTPDLCQDVLHIAAASLPQQPDILWASPPCEAFSVAAIGKNWNRDYTPKHERAVMARTVVLRTLSLIEQLKPKWFFIENPRGMLRKMPFMYRLTRRTVTYCQYGDIRMKPTDIWTNADWWTPRPACSNGSRCHEAAPRGAKTGTQGIKGAKDRGRIPAQLFEDIFSQIPAPANDNTPPQRPC